MPQFLDQRAHLNDYVLRRIVARMLHNPLNEEIVDVTIGRLKFDGEYQGSMPTLGCPGFEGKTLKYVEQDE
jgi:hypothetical protein